MECQNHPPTHTPPPRSLACLCCQRRWGLAKSLAVGVALVSCMPGGTASNIVAYIAKGDMVRARARAHMRC